MVGLVSVTNYICLSIIRLFAHNHNYPPRNHGCFPERPYDCQRAYLWQHPQGLAYVCHWVHAWKPWPSRAYSLSLTVSMLIVCLQKLVLCLKDASEHAYIKAFDGNKQCHKLVPISDKERTIAAIDVKIERLVLFSYVYFLFTVFLHFREPVHEWPVNGCVLPQGDPCHCWRYLQGFCCSQARHEIPPHHHSPKWWQWQRWRPCAQAHLAAASRNVQAQPQEVVQLAQLPQNVRRICQARRRLIVTSCCMDPSHFLPLLSLYVC